jgi:hypothetical protein
MRANIAITAILTTALSFVSKTWAAPDPNFHIYLAFGQSNMQGAGQIENQDKTVDKRFQMIATAAGCNNRRVGEWYDAIPPLAHCGGGLGPVDYFGRTLVKKLPEQIKVGVAVVAVAGCDIQLFEKNNYRSYNMADWMKGIVDSYGGNPYGRLIDMGKKAQQVGVIKGILLHQGETNNGQSDWPNRVKAIYEDILKDLSLKAEEVPLLVGETVDSDSGGVCGYHNSVIARIPQVIKNGHVISSKGLGQQGDGLHFTSAAYRTFGERYADTMLKLLGNVQPVEGGDSGNNNQDPTTTTPQSGNVSDGWYYIKNPASGKYLAVRNGIGADAQNVEISSTKQKWKISNNDDGTVLIISELGDYALDVSAGSSNNGANIQIYSAYGGEAQRFIIRETYTSGNYVITTKVTNGSRALDVEGNKTAEGTNICQWDDGEKSNQIWTLEAIGGQQQEQPQTATCWSSAMGYSCCKSCDSFNYKDNDGEWGIENDAWCGIPKECSNNGATTCKGALGYPCCKSTCNVYSSDESGKWGI